jgi:hypothetical protein
MNDQNNISAGRGAGLDSSLATGSVCFDGHSLDEIFAEYRNDPLNL